MTDLIVICNMTFVPTALISEFNYCEEHIFYCSRIVLHRKASVPIGIDPLSKNTNYARRRLSGGRIYDFVQFMKCFFVVYGYQTCCLLIAA